MQPNNNIQGDRMKRKRLLQRRKKQEEKQKQKMFNYIFSKIMPHLKDL